MCKSVIVGFTANNILPVCSLSSSQIHDVLNGRLPYFCWQMKRTRGRKLKVLPLFHTPAATHTDSAAILGDYQCESRAYTSAYMHVAMHCCLCFENNFAFLKKIVWEHLSCLHSLHWCSAFSQYWENMVLHDMVQWFDLSGLTHTQHLVQCCLTFPGR